MVKSNGAVGLPIYDFLLVSNSNYTFNSHRLGVITTRKKFLLSLIIRAKCRPPPPPQPTLGIFFQNRITLSLGPREASYQE